MFIINKMISQVPVTGPLHSINHQEKVGEETFTGLLQNLYTTFKMSIWDQLSSSDQEKPLLVHQMPFSNLVIPYTTSSDQQ